MRPTKRFVRHFVILSLVCILTGCQTNGQLTTTTDFIPPSEYRDGYIAGITVPAKTFQIEVIKDNQVLAQLSRVYKQGEQAYWGYRIVNMATGSDTDQPLICEIYLGEYFASDSRFSGSTKRAVLSDTNEMGLTFNHLSNTDITTKFTRLVMAKNPAENILVTLSSMSIDDSAISCLDDSNAVVIYEDYCDEDKEIHYFCQEKDLGAGDRGFQKLLKELEKLDERAPVRIQSRVFPTDCRSAFEWPICGEERHKEFDEIVKRKSLIVSHGF